VLRSAGRKKSMLRCLRREKNVLRCLRREECSEVLRKCEECARVFRKGEEYSQVFKKREEIIVFYIELHVACLIASGVKWIASFYKIKPIRLICLSRLHSNQDDRKPTLIKDRNIS
jgi:hypothetical protein